MLIDFSVQKTFNETLDIVDPGNCCVRGEDAEGSYFYIRIKSVMGKLNILKVGPVMPDFGLLDGYSISYKKVNYNVKTIVKELSMFLNDPLKKIISASETTEEEMFENVLDLQTEFNNV